MSPLMFLHIARKNFAVGTFDWSMGLGSIRYRCSVSEVAVKYWVAHDVSTLSLAAITTCNVP